MDTKRSSRETLLLAAAAALTVLLYSASLGGPFVFDDQPNIVENPHIRISGLSAVELYDAAFRSPIRSRPVAYASFALNYLSNGYNVVGYRFINILIHVLNGCLLYALTRLTFRAPALSAHRPMAAAVACAAALLWLVHPLHTQSVAYIVQRMTSLAATFYLLSLACYAGARLAENAVRRRLFYAGCILSGLLAAATKEITATLPVFIFLYEWYFFQHLDGRWLRRRLFLLAGAAAAAGVFGLAYLGFADPVQHILAAYEGAGISVGQRLMTQLRVVVFYISLLLWPAASRLNLDHHAAVSLSLVDPVTTLLSLLLLAAIVAAAVLMARREPLGSFAILWFLGNLVIESSVIRLELVFEHRTYLPSVFPVMAAVALGARFIRKKQAAIALLALATAACAYSTWERSKVWADDVALWGDCVQKSPLKARPHNNLGSALSNRGRFDEAAVHLARAVELNPEYADARYNLGYVRVRLGQLEAGIRELTEAVRLEPDNYMARNNLGVAFLIREDFPAAIEHFKEALRLKPGFTSAHNNLGVALKNQGELAAAVSSLREALRLNPAYAEAWNNLGVALREQGNRREAAESFRRALRIHPDYPAARRNLEETETQGETPKAN
jgi:tetratricopeptide (TPR) repeat protein